MANEFKHKDPGAELTSAEFIASDGTGHIFDSQAAGDILYASSTTVLTRLAKGADDDLLTLSSGAPAWTSSPTLTALTVDDVTVNGKVITMTGSSGDTAVFTVGTNGTLSLVTTDAAASAADLTLDADGEIVIDAADAAGVIIKINGTAQLSVVDGSITPTTNNDIDLGASSYQFKDGYFDGTLEADAVTIGGTNVVTGSLVTTLGTVSAGVWQGTAIATGYIAADAITGAKIADDAIDSEHYTDGSIDAAHLAADAVTGAKIADNAIDSEHYTDGSIDNAHLADDAVDSDEIAAGAIDTAHIADNQVTAAKIFDLARGSVLVGNSSAATAELTIGSNTYVLTSDGTDIAWAAASSGPSQANQTAIEAETNQDTYIPPDLVRKSPGVAKAYCEIAANGTIVAESYNVNAITDTGSGDRTVVWETDFSGTDYSSLCSLNLDTTDVGLVIMDGANQAAGSHRHICYNSGAGLSDRATTVCAFGDQ
jgi:hypothetical protein